MIHGVVLKMDEKTIRSESLNGIYRELAELIGTEAVIKIHSTHRGQTISFPVELFNRDYIAEQIIDEYDGKNIRELATKFGYSDKWIRKIVNSKKKQEENENV